MDIRHGGNIYEIERTRNINREQLIDYSANINPLGSPPDTTKAVEAALQKMSRYPDITYGDLRKAIAKYENVPETFLLPGNGAADVLFGLTRALHPAHAAVISPAFSEYRQACEAVNAAVTDVILSESIGFHPNEELLTQIPPETDLTFLCTPNNPTGAVCPRSLIVSLANQSRQRGGVLLVDESFLDFREDEPEHTAVPLCQEYPNLIVLKSLTKFYAMAGVRIGYAVCSSPTLAAEYQRVNPPWMVSAFAEELTIMALSAQAYQQESRHYTACRATELYQALKNLPGIRPYLPGANFILFACEKPIDLKEKLLARQILIRRCEDFAGLGKNWYRVCVSKPEKNNQLIQALSEILQSANDEEYHQSGVVQKGTGLS